MPDPSSGLHRTPADGDEDDEDARVTVLVRPRCRTCDRMVGVVEEICRRVGEPWEVVDIDDPAADPELRAEFTDAVPVTLVDGHEVGSWTLDPAALERALAGAGPAGTGR